MTSTTTVIDTNWKNTIPKDSSWQAVENSGKGLGTKIWVAKVTIGSTVTYTTGGLTVSVDPNAQVVDNILACIPISNTAGVQAVVNSTSGRNITLQAYTASATPNSATALVEVANASTLLESKVFLFLVIAS